MTKTLVATAEEPAERPRRTIEVQLTVVVELDPDVRVDRAIEAEIAVLTRKLGRHGDSWWLQRVQEFRGKVRRSTWSYTRPRSLRRR